MKEKLKQNLRYFLFPNINRRFLIRLAVLIVLSVIIFGYIVRPARIRGESMEPTYMDGGVMLIFRGYQLFRYPKPKVGDVVAIRLSGHSVMYLKRIVAEEGQVVEFRSGKLFVDGEMVDEPYVVYPCDWESEPSLVEPGKIFAVGDNRSTDINSHTFGKVDKQRIEGIPLW